LAVIVLARPVKAPSTTARARAVTVRPRPKKTSVTGIRTSTMASLVAGSQRHESIVAPLRPAYSAAISPGTCPLGMASS